MRRWAPRRTSCAALDDMSAARRGRTGAPAAMTDPWKREPGQVSLKIPKLRRQTFETATNERHRRRESSIPKRR
jgi:transposase-like protein